MLSLLDAVPPSPILEWHDLARAGILFSYAFRPKLAIHPRTRCAYHQPHDDTTTIVVFTAAIVQLERGTLFNVRRWRRICEFCGCGSDAEWDCGHHGRYEPGHRNHAVAATLARKTLRRSHR